ncbi:MAG TPA: hypothetical protein VKZ55_03585, partial [Microthrixaceae bacterium]|nr:hypothetical protein [Microthrixaceae bacterium]
ELQSRLSDFLDDVRDDDANSDVHVSSAGWAAVELTLAGGGAPDDEELFDLVTGEPWLAGTQVEPLFADDARSEPLTDFVAGLTAAVITLVVAWRLLRAAAAWRGRQQDARAALTRQRDTRRDIARRAVARLERDLARADTSVETWAAAQDRLRAARSLTDSPDVLDLLGAEVLARQGIALLQDPASPYRPCFFDPRHGAAEDTVPIGRATVPACAACTARARDGAAPRALEVPTRGRLRPYYEGRSVWARTGFGALDDTTASRVLERGRR